MSYIDYLNDKNPYRQAAKDILEGKAKPVFARGLGKSSTNLRLGYEMLRLIWEQMQMKVCFTDLENEPRFDVTIGYPYRASIFAPPLLCIMKHGGTLYAYKGRFIITTNILNLLKG